MKTRCMGSVARRLLIGGGVGFWPMLATGKPVPDCVPPAGVSQVVPTDHFLLMSEADIEFSRATARRLEHVHGIVLDHLRSHEVRLAPPADRLPVVLYDNPMALAARAKRSGLDGAGVAALGGFYDAAANAVYLTRVVRPPQTEAPAEVNDPNAAREEKAGTARPAANELADEALRLTLQHEVVHLLLANVLPEGRVAKLAPWLSEGLACQFEGDLSKPSAEVVVGNQWRASDLRGALGLAAGEKTVTPRDVERALDARKLLPLGSLLRRTEALESAPEHAASYYAQAWAGVFFLRISRPDLYGRLLRAVLNGPDLGEEPVSVEELEAAFGGSDSAAMADWINQVLRYPVDPDGTIR